MKIRGKNTARNHTFEKFYDAVNQPVKPMCCFEFPIVEGTNI